MAEKCNKKLMPPEQFNQVTASFFDYVLIAVFGISHNFQDRSPVHRVLARISKMPVQNSNFKISARPDLATYVLKILIPATFNSLVCQNGNLYVSYVLEDSLLGKYLVITPQKSKLKNHHRNFCLSNQEVFRKLPVQKTGRAGPGLVPAGPSERLMID